MAPPRKVDGEDRERMIARYGSGESASKLAAEYGIAESSIRGAARRAGFAACQSRGRGHALTDAEKTQIIALSADGFGGAAIARQVGRGKSTVNSFLVACGLSREPSRGGGPIGHPDEMKREVVHRYTAGAGSKALSAEFGISSATVLKWARRAGVPIRGRGRHPRRVRPRSPVPPLRAAASELGRAWKRPRDAEWLGGVLAAADAVGEAVSEVRCAALAAAAAKDDV